MRFTLQYIIINNLKFLEHALNKIFFFSENGSQNDDDDDDDDDDEDDNTEGRPGNTSDDYDSDELECEGRIIIIITNNQT